MKTRTQIIKEIEKLQEELKTAPPEELFCCLYEAHKPSPHLTFADAELEQKMYPSICKSIAHYVLAP